MGRRWRQKPQEVYVLAAAALLSSQVPVSHIHPFPCGAGRGPVRALGPGVSLQSHCPHNLGSSLLRGHPESSAWPLHPHFLGTSLLLQVQPGAASSRKPTRNTSFLHRKGVLWVAPGGHGRDLDPRPWTPSLQLSTPRTSAFSLVLPYASVSHFGG